MLANSKAEAPMLELLMSLRMSGIQAASKALRGRLSPNPRRMSNRAIGLLVASGISVAEEAWKVAIHERVPARCHVWSNEGVHRTAIPPWRHVEHGTPSRYAYTFETVISMLVVFTFDEISKPHPSVETVGYDLLVPFPKVYIPAHVAMEDFSAMPIDLGLELELEHVNWEEFGVWRSAGVENEWGCCIAKRCAQVYVLGLIVWMVGMWIISLRGARVIRELRVGCLGTLGEH
jgi:hypothetical protein